MLFFRAHHRFAHAYRKAVMSRHASLRMAGVVIGRLGRSGGAAHHSDPLSTSSTRLHDREEDLQATSDKLGCILF